MKRIRNALVIDDARFMREVLRDVLADRVDAVHVAGTLDEAVEAARLHSPEVITLDLTLDANEMTQGLTVLDRLRVTSPASRIIVVSALDQEWLRNETAARGAAAYIKKPFDKGELLARIETLLEEST